MTREDKLRRFALSYFGQTELEKINNLLKKNPGKLGLRVAIARLHGGLDSLDYPESAYALRRVNKERKRLEKLQERQSRVLTVSFGEILLRENKNRKPA